MSGVISKPLILAAMLGVLGACTVPEPSQPVPPADNDMCKASQFQGLVGQPGTVLGGMKLPQGTRTIGPNDAVSMDYRPSRLNFETGKDGRIAKIACY